MAWAQCQYNREQINLAGKSLLRLATDDPKRSEVLDVIANWRSCHGFPLQVVKMTLKKRRNKVNPKAIVAQRVKRLASISLKLLHNSTMRLSQMQDIGGSRVVLNNCAEVDKLVFIYEEAASKHPNRGPLLIKKVDYIGEPKIDGYRSVHLIIKYQSKDKIN